MEQKNSFFKAVCNLAIPVTLQSILQSSFSVVDQIMIGQLGSVSVAGVGLAGKFSSIYSVVISAIGAVAGIMISHYTGQEEKREVRRSFYANLLVGGMLAVIFTLLCVLFPGAIMSLYTKEAATQQEAAAYLALIAGTFLPLALATMYSTLLRCTGNPRLPLYASLVSALLNTGINYLLIFGKGGFPQLGVRGAAIATVISQCANFLLMGLMVWWKKSVPAKESKAEKIHVKLDWRQYLSMLLPILVCEVAWSLGENVYAVIYGHLGTDASAAMTLTSPIQGLLIGALCGLSQAASVIIGKQLGSGENEQAYTSSKKLLYYGTVGSVLLSMVVLATSSLYVEIYQVEEAVKQLTVQILTAYALIAPFKVLNMILGGGIIRSGGRTKYTMYIDLIGTWCFGVPLGLFAAFVCRLSIPYVYFILSLEECIRFGISLIVFRQKRWMNQL